VLDDGWFRHRRDDTAGLGDWYVDPTCGRRSHPLIDRVRGLGMQFGLWVEPEMVNPGSDLAGAHPDWVLNPTGRPGATSRARRRQRRLPRVPARAPRFAAHRVRDRVPEVDHNRDLVDSPVHAQTLAVYALLRRAARPHPGVEIESCSSGGARVDLGILERTDRVWASDTNDALERQHISAGRSSCCHPS